jgi:NitT/TauT family transport system substrate-binding protein
MTTSSCLSRWLPAVLLCLIIGQAGAETKLKMVLNWTYQGPQGIFFLAQERGYFKAEGIDLQIDQGKGSGAAVLDVARGTYDVGFGDINTVIQIAAPRPSEAPLGVYMIYHSAPFAVASLKSRNIRTPKDLIGRTVAAPAGSATLKLMQLALENQGVDPAKVSIVNANSNLLTQMMSRGQVDSIAGFVSTIAMGAQAQGIDPDKELNFVMFSEYGVRIYSNALVVSRDLARKNPNAVRGLVRAVNRGIADTLRDPDAAIAALIKREPLLKREIERELLVRTIRMEMSHPESKESGFGNIREDRMKLAIDQVVKAFELSRTPAIGEIFSSEFLPPIEERRFNLNVR